MPTKIEWTDMTWNPITGCSKVSPGCANCYIPRTPPFRMNGRKFERVGNEMATGVILHPDRLEQPLRKRKPQRIFVNSMSDLFHEDVPFEFIARVWDTMFDSCMGDNPISVKRARHTYQILTKRPDRMLEFANWMRDTQFRRIDYENVHLYVSVENQYWADRRIPLLLQTPAAVRGVSYEPALKAVDFRNWFCGFPGDKHHLHLPSLDHIIMGGESGPGARPMDIKWVRSTVAQCKAAGVPVFVKQMGSVWAKQHGGNSKGGDMDLWPEDLRIREFPELEAKGSGS